MIIITRGYISAAGFATELRVAIASSNLADTKVCFFADTNHALLQLTTRKIIVA